MRRLALFVLAVSVGAPLAAHDFWIDAARYRLPAPGEVAVRFLVGDLADVEPWETLWRKVVSLRSYGPGGVVDRQAGLLTSDGGGGGGALIRFARPGTHVLALESNQAESNLPAAEFNSYAEHEGLTPALVRRKTDGTGDAPGRELYSRRAKALIQVGNLLTDDPTVAIGQTLEIVPTRNPLALTGRQPLRVRILFRGRPLAGASVVLEPLDGAPRHGVPAITGADGGASFAFDKSGRWRVGVVWTQPISHPRADFDTVFASLTFGY